MFTLLRLEKYTGPRPGFVKFVGEALYDQTTNSIFHLLTWHGIAHLHVNIHDASNGSMTLSRYLIIGPFKYVYSAVMYQHDSPNNR